VIELAIGAALIGTAALVGRRLDGGAMGGPRLGAAITPSMDDKKYAAEFLRRARELRGAADAGAFHADQLLEQKRRWAQTGPKQRRLWHKELCEILPSQYAEALDQLADARDASRNPRAAELLQDCQPAMGVHHVTRKSQQPNAPWAHECADFFLARDSMDGALRDLQRMRKALSQHCKTTVRRIPLSELMPIRGEPGKFLFR